MNPETMQKSDESAKAYRIRLYKNKELYGLTNKEIGDLCNKAFGVNFDESCHRKKIHSYLKGYEDAKHDFADNSSALIELHKKEVETQEKIVELRDTKRELNRWIRESSRTKNMTNMFVDAIKYLPELSSPTVQFSSTGRKVGISGVADAHVGRDCVIRDLFGNILNEYNEDVFHSRMWRLRDKLVSIIEKEQLDKMVIVGVGDLIEGATLRISQLQGLEFGLTDQTMRVADFMAIWLNDLSNYAYIDFYMCGGNHAEIRNFSSKSGDFPNENMERVIGWYIKARLQNNSNIDVKEVKPIQLIQECGLSITMSHGQFDKNIDRVISDYSDMYKIPIDIHICGHMHFINNKAVSMNDNGNVEVLQFPSICGIDDYSEKLKKSACAGSTCLILEEDNKDRTIYNINLQE